MTAWAFALPCMWRLQRGMVGMRERGGRMMLPKSWGAQIEKRRRWLRENQVEKRIHKAFATKADSRMAVKMGLGSPSAQSRR